MKLVYNSFRGFGKILYTDKGELVSQELYTVIPANEEITVDFLSVKDETETVISVPQSVMIEGVETQRILKFKQGQYLNVADNDFSLTTQIVSVGKNNTYLLNGDFTEQIIEDESEDLFLLINLDYSFFNLSEELPDGVYYTDYREMVIVSKSFSEIDIKTHTVYSYYPPLRNSAFDYQVAEWISLSQDKVMDMIPKHLQLSIEQSYNVLDLSDIINFIILSVLEMWEATLENPSYRFTGKLTESIRKWNPKFLINKETKAVESFFAWSHW